MCLGWRFVAGRSGLILEKRGMALECGFALSLGNPGAIDKKERKKIMMGSSY